MIFFNNAVSTTQYEYILLHCYCSNVYFTTFLLLKSIFHYIFIIKNIFYYIVIVVNNPKIP